METCSSPPARLQSPAPVDWPAPALRAVPAVNPSHAAPTVGGPFTVAVKPPPVCPPMTREAWLRRAKPPPKGFEEASFLVVAPTPPPKCLVAVAPKLTTPPPQGSKVAPKVTGPLPVKLPPKGFELPTTLLSETLSSSNDSAKSVTSADRAGGTSTGAKALAVFKAVVMTNPWRPRLPTPPPPPPPSGARQ